MAQRNDDSSVIDRDLGPEADDEDDRLGEAVEEYLALAERDQAPDLEAFLARHADMKDELRAALEGLELVHGLVGRVGGSGSWGPSHGGSASRWLETGQRIAGYRVVRELGRGGMGTVYEAVHVGLDRPVALKVLGTHAAPDSSARRRFLNEAKTAAGLHHTHIVPVFDVGQVGGLCYYAMQRIEGSGLDRVIRHLRRIRPAGPGPAGASTPDGPAPSSFGSRFGQVWLRVTPGWLWRPSRQERAAGRASRGVGDPSAAASSPARSGVEGRGALPSLPAVDVTASWGSRRGAASEWDLAGDATGSRVGLTDLPGRKGPEAAGRGDEPPPFLPPGGSAYFRWVASVGLQAADALAHAHHQGVIHRDVKPSNLLIDDRGNIWVTDFGLARRLADPGLTHHDSLLGTPRYMSPEQARAAGQVDGRTDVYSLGATLYELLTLRPPFDGQSAAELVDQIGRDDPIPPRRFEPRVPRDLETIVLKALAKRPSDRYAGAAELAEDLARFLSYAPVKARRIGPAGRLWRIARRHPQIAAVTTTAAATIVAIATYSYARILGSRADVIEALGIAEQKTEALKEANSRLVKTLRKDHLQAAQMLEAFEAPDRRGRGLGHIREAVELGIPAGERAEFRDEAVKLLVMRDVQTRIAGPETGRGNALVFGPQGHRLWVLSDDEESLSQWDIAQDRRLMQVSLRNEAGAEDVATEATAAPGAERVEGGPAAGPPAPAAIRARARTASGPPSQRRGSLAVIGNWVAVLGPDRGAITLIDPLSATPLRKITSPGQEIRAMVADPGGRRLVTVEQAPEESPTASEAAMLGVEPDEPGEYRVSLWDLEHIDRPRARLGRYPRRGAAANWPPMAAISPDGKRIAVARADATAVWLYSADDGAPRRPIENQAEVSGLALGPDGLMAVAGRDGQVRLYDLDNPRPFITGLKPWLNFTWLLRFSPRGTLALAGSGKVELWDPVSASRVAALTGSEQSVDLAFSPDGRMLAATGRTEDTRIWTIEDSAARTQLSGFDAGASSLAFGPGASLAVGCWDGTVWTWQPGRCPEARTSSPPSMVGEADPTGARGRPTPRGTPAGPHGHNAGRAPAGTESAHPALADRGPGDRGPGDRGPGDRGPGDRGGRSRGPRGFGSPPAPEPRPASLAFDAGGRLLAHDAAGLRVWPVGAGDAPAAVPLPEPPTVRFNSWPIARSTDGRALALLRASSVSLWRDEAPDRVIPVVPPPGPEGPVAPASPGGTLHFRAIQIAPRGDRLYLLDAPGRLHVWDLAASPDGRAIHAREPDRGLPPVEGIFSSALRGDGAMLAVGDRAGAVSLIDIPHGRVAGTIRPSADEAGSIISALAFSSDGRILAVGSMQGSIRLYTVGEPARPRLLFRLPGHGFVNNLIFDAPGTRLASASRNDPLVEVWDLDLIRRELAALGLGVEAP